MPASLSLSLLPLDLINLTNDPHCSMATLADYIFERLKNTSWVVVFKNLVLAHNLITLGNEVKFDPLLPLFLSPLSLE